MIVEVGLGGNVKERLEVHLRLGWRGHPGPEEAQVVFSPAFPRRQC